MNFQLLITFYLFIGISFGFDKIPKEEEDKIIENYFQKFPQTQGRRFSKFNNAKENILKHFYEAQDHNEKFRSGDETYEMELNELSALSDENLAETRLGFIDQPDNDPQEVNSTIISEIQNKFRSPS